MISLYFILKDGVEFPSFEDQIEITEGFKEKGGAGFENFEMALDEMLVSMAQFAKKECDNLKIGEWSFYQKDEVSYPILAGCNDKVSISMG
jgi:hypothetical protein